MTQTPRPTPPPPPITGAVYLPTTTPLPADPTPAARRWCADVAEAESLGHAALVLRYAHALSALRTVWRSRSRRIAAAAHASTDSEAKLAAIRLLATQWATQWGANANPLLASAGTQWQIQDGREILAILDAPAVRDGE